MLFFATRFHGYQTKGVFFWSSAGFLTPITQSLHQGGRLTGYKLLQRKSLWRCRIWQPYYYDMARHNAKNCLAMHGFITILIQLESQKCNPHNCFKFFDQGAMQLPAHETVKCRRRKFSDRKHGVWQACPSVDIIIKVEWGPRNLVTWWQHWMVTCSKSKQQKKKTQKHSCGPHLS